MDVGYLPRGKELVKLLLFLAAALAAHAQTETVLYHFCSQPNCSDGAYALSRLISDGVGNLYGTTLDGGLWDAGTVFELSPNGDGGWNERSLYSFCSAANCTDGSFPFDSNVIFDRVGNLYGTTSTGGAYGYGVVFELSLEGGMWSETVVYNFLGGTDGANPGNGLVSDAVGNFFGTTTAGGQDDIGTVFELTASGGDWTERVIYGVGGYSGLTIDSAGNVFGVSNSVVGRTGYQSVFELSPDGKGGWNPNLIYTHSGARMNSGSTQGTPFLDKSGSLYVTSAYGGNGNGKVYKLSFGKKGKWTAKTLYTFKGYREKDGSWPFGGVILDGAGNVFGTTWSGYPDNGGTVYELVPPIRHGTYTEKILWNFSGSDGANPESSLILDGTGNLYGTTYFGGGSGVSGGYGVVFEVTP